MEQESVRQPGPINVRKPGDYRSEKPGTVRYYLLNEFPGGVDFATDEGTIPHLEFVQALDELEADRHRRVSGADLVTALKFFQDRRLDLARVPSTVKFVMDFGTSEQALGRWREKCIDLVAERVLRRHGRAA